MSKLNKIGYVGMVLFLVVLTIQACQNKLPNQEKSTQGFVFLERLSDYGFFSGALAELHPKVHLIPYTLSSTLFTDYAIKDRFIVLPKGQKMKFVNSEELDFPDSTIIIKNFSYRNAVDKKIMIETRLLVKDPADHAWKVMNYLWSDDQKDAVKHIRGATVPIVLKDDAGKLQRTNYLVPNTNDCKRCHNKDGKLLPIGPKPRNLNVSIPGESQNQLVKLARARQIGGLPDLSEVEALPNWLDKANFSLDQRARAYLDINCAHCHREGGDAYNTGLFLEYTQRDTTRLGYYKSPVSAGAGAGGLNYDLIPGHAEQSILHYRMKSTEPGVAMPELARTLVHKEAVALIRQWINQLK
ncbi:SO2930 family diheme c-type cytochrome [Sphingobacterium lactis]|uniref:SO2930 family diheme c-type cytochrome n=1 Tax=Sphingobacterium lactis TaxID=797291 RepID=UPI003DA20A8D